MGLLCDKDDPPGTQISRALVAFYVLLFGLALAVVGTVVLLLRWGLF